MALPICRHSKAAMDIIVPKKLRAPSDSEIAIGAVAESDIYIVNEEAVAYLEITDEYIQHEVRQQIDVIKDIRRKYCSGSKTGIAGKKVLIVDDGIATGMTVLAAIRYLKLHNAREIIVAAPVASKEAVYLLEANDAKVIASFVPDTFTTIDSYYDNFEQLADSEITNIIDMYSI